ncbi:hypothetical protein SDC9_117672 [bioreactor metagenome]|uniref:Uncharacterized protein n=1 Tax=bioreactor metagenome TaxID=1076179 RepID=A0A645C8H9_9ZZZZ
MLDRPRDAAGDVKLGRHHLAGLPDLPVVRRKAAIDRRARGTDRRAELVGQRLDDREVLFRADAAAARDDDLRRGQLGAIRGRHLVLDPGREPLVARRGGGLDRRRGARARRLEGRRAHGHHLDLVRGFHRLDRVAGIDRALEGVTIDDADDIREHHHVEQRRDPRSHVLRRRRRGRDDMADAARERDDEIGERLGEPMRIGRVIGDQHLRHAVKRREGGRIDARAGHQHRHRAELLRRRQRLRRRVEAAHFRNQKNRHQITPASLSLPISSSTEPTLMPAERPAGSAVFTTVSRGVTSTP